MPCRTNDSAATTIRMEANPWCRVCLAERTANLSELRDRLPARTTRYKRNTAGQNVFQAELAGVPECLREIVLPEAISVESWRGHCSWIGSLVLTESQRHRLNQFQRGAAYDFNFGGMADYQPDNARCFDPILFGDYV